MAKKLKLHILGIAGTFMAGIATLAKELGYEVTGSDLHCYPPMSTYLEKLGIKVFEGFDDLTVLDGVDEIIIGNVMRRGMPVIEHMLEKKMKLVSGPAWLSENILSNRWVLCVTGTHGKTTTSSMLSFILEKAGLSPGFLIGGIPNDFGVSARLGGKEISHSGHSGHSSHDHCHDFFVIEGDEYDTSFFDKRSKFVHFKPDSLIINNLEFDHADIFDDLKMIQKQFHHLLKILPKGPRGKLIYPVGHESIAEVIQWGCYSNQEIFSVGNMGEIDNKNIDWVGVLKKSSGAEFEVFFKQKKIGLVQWSLLGEHNIHNALAALSAAHHIGIDSNIAISALSEFSGVKKRLELKGIENKISVYDDFAHHPTAIKTTVEGLKEKISELKKDKNNSAIGKLIAVFEPRSNTLKKGQGKEALLEALGCADEVYLYQSGQVKWNIAEQIDLLGLNKDKNNNKKFYVFLEIEALVKKLKLNTQPGDHILVMSNGAFENIHEKILDILKN